MNLPYLDKFPCLGQTKCLSAWLVASYEVKIYEQILSKNHVSASVKVCDKRSFVHLFVGLFHGPVRVDLFHLGF